MLIFQRFDYIKLISYQRVKKCECLNVIVVIITSYLSRISKNEIAVCI